MYNISSALTNIQHKCNRDLLKYSCLNLVRILRLNFIIYYEIQIHISNHTEENGRSIDTNTLIYAIKFK